MNTQNLYLDTVIPGLILSTVPYCPYLDHYVFKDPISGYNIFYPLTAYGGDLTIPLSIFKTVSGGFFKFDADTSCYQDVCFTKYDVPPIRLYCITNLNFVLSGYDETTSKVIKIIYTFGDNTPEKTIDLTLFTALSSPKFILVSKKYYPGSNLLTTYYPSISVIKSDCCVNTFNLTLCSFKCGITDIYNDVAMIDAQQAGSPYNVIVTMEKKGEQQVFSNILSLNEPFYAIPGVSALPNIVEPTPIVEAVVSAPSAIPPTQPSPVRPVDPLYEYKEGAGIDLNPIDIITLSASENFVAAVDSGIIILGDGPPYLPLSGIKIDVV